MMTLILAENFWAVGFTTFGWHDYGEVLLPISRGDRHHRDVPSKFPDIDSGRIRGEMLTLIPHSAIV